MCQLLDPTDINIGIYPQPKPNSHPFLREIRPLASSGVYSPPPSQPLVGLPNHPPLSPIAHIPNSPGVPQTPDSVFTTEEININKGKPINKNLQRSNVKDWLTNLSPEQEWDHFSPLPIFQNQQEFWNSRGLLPILSTGESQIDINQNHLIQCVSTDSEDFSLVELPNIISVVSNMATEMENICLQIANAKEKIKYLVERFSEDDVDQESIDDGHVAQQLKEIRDEEINIGIAVQKAIEKYKDELGEERINSLKADIKDLSSIVKAHEKKIRNKVKSFVPAPKTLTSYETEMLEIQR